MELPAFIPTLFKPTLSLDQRDLSVQINHITSLLSVLQWPPNSYRADLRFITHALKSLHHLAATSLSSCASPTFYPSYAKLPVIVQLCGALSALCMSLCMELIFLTCFIWLFLIFHNSTGTSPFGLKSLLCAPIATCAYVYIITYPVSLEEFVHVKCHPLDGELSKCRKCVLIPLGPPNSPFYSWCMPSLSWAPDLYCLHHTTKKVKSFQAQTNI